MELTNKLDQQVLEVAWTKIISNAGDHYYYKDFACFLFGKESPDKSILYVSVCLCPNTKPRRQRLQEDYKDFVKLDVGGNSLVVSRGCDVTLSSYIETPDNAVTTDRVTPKERIFTSTCFEAHRVRLVAHFEVNMMPLIPSGTKVVCLVDNGERRASFKSSTRLQFYLKEFSKEGPIANNGTKSEMPGICDVL